MNKQHIAQSFGKASQTYDQDAPVQKWTAQFLCDFVAGLDQNNQPLECLEIGCGTGFLTEEMLKLDLNANWTVTDLSENMLAQCRERVGERATFHTMDGEHPKTDQQFDLIVSSLAFQWFHSLEEGLVRLTSLLKPGGRLVFTTLGTESFKEWRHHLQAHNEPVGLHDYPVLNEIRNFQIKGCSVRFEQVIKQQPYSDALSFLRALKAIGAQAPRSEYEALSPGKLRKLLNEFEKHEECIMTYDILLGDIEKQR